MKPKLAVFTHFVLWGEPADSVLAMARRRYDGAMQLGEDLMRFHVGDQVTTERMPADTAPRTRP